MPIIRGPPLSRWNRGTGAGHDGAMPTPSVPAGLIVCLEDVSVDDLVGGVEVMIQEGLTTFSLPIGHEGQDDIVAIFGARARFGLHGAVTADALVSARDWAAFALVDLMDAALQSAAAETGIPVFAQAMTPGEVRAVLAQGATGALLFPADVVGHVMAERLRSLGLVDKVVPRGGIGAFSATEWMKAGAPAACVDGTLLGDAFRGGNLGMLRDRCGSFVKVNREALTRA